MSKGKWTYWCVESASEEFLDLSSSLDLCGRDGWKFRPGFTRIVANKVCLLVGTLPVLLLLYGGWGLVVGLGRVVLLRLLLTLFTVLLLCLVLIGLLLSLEMYQEKG